MDDGVTDIDDPNDVVDIGDDPVFESINLKSMSFDGGSITLSVIISNVEDFDGKIEKISAHDYSVRTATMVAQCRIQRSEFKQQKCVVFKKSLFNHDKRHV